MPCARLRDLRAWALALLAADLAAVAAGCASAGYAAAGCEIYRYSGVNVLACSPAAVDRHCHKYVTNWDDGTPADSRKMRACFRPGRFGRRPVIVISKDAMGCLPHELAHLDNRTEAERIYPCVEDLH